MNQIKLSSFAQRVAVATVTVVAVCGILYMAWLARVPLAWIAIAAFLGVAVNPLVLRLQKSMPKKSLALATLLVLLALVTVCGILAVLFLGPLLQQASNLKNMPAITEVLKQAKANMTVPQLAQFLADMAARAVELTMAFVSIISLMFFMTMEGHKMKEISLRFVGPAQHDRVARLGSSIYTIISGYVVGNLTISGIYGLASGLVLWLCGSPYFVVLGLAAALIDLIPLVGATIAAILIAAVCLLGGQTWAAIIFIVFTIVYVQFESAVLNPAIYSNTVEVSPLTVLVAILIGGVVAGVVGALVAIPIAATVRVIARELFAQRLGASQ